MAEKQSDIVKQLALSALAVVAVFWGYKAGAELIDATREGKARAALRPYIDNVSESGGSMRLGRFAYFGRKNSEYCLEFTQLDRSRQTTDYGGVRIRRGKVVHVYPSFEECLAWATT